MAIKFEAGKSDSSSQRVEISDPGSTSGSSISIETPSDLDICNGETCQMNAITVAEMPVESSSTNNGSFVSSLISISFESSDTDTNPGTNIVTEIDVNSLESPIDIQILLDPDEISVTNVTHCVFIDERTNEVKDTGIITTIDNETGVTVCSTYHLTDFTMEEYDPTYS